MPLLNVPLELMVELTDGWIKTGNCLGIILFSLEQNLPDVHIFNTDLSVKLQLQCERCFTAILTNTQGLKFHLNLDGQMFTHAATQWTQEEQFFLKDKHLNASSTLNTYSTYSSVKLLSISLDVFEK